MPSDWIPNTATQLERAIRAYLVSVGAVDAQYTFISNENRDRVNDSVTIIARASSTTPAEYSGNELFTVSITHKFQSIAQSDDANPDNYRIKLDQSVGRVQYALMNIENNTMRPVAAWISSSGRALAVDSSDGEDEALAKIAQNNEDMAEFTCLSIRYLGSMRGQPDDDSTQWAEVRNYEIGACSANVD